VSSAAAPPRATGTPGAALLHPAPAAAFALVALNDLWLKPWHPGWLSGKLSDLGLCFLLPVFLVALWEWGAWVVVRLRRRGRWAAGRGVKLGACGLAAGYFAALQIVPAAAELHVAVLGALVPTVRFVVTPDVSDLIALLITPLAWLYLGRRLPGATP
jgi:hypothetical protein